MNLIVDLQYFPSIILYKKLDKISNIVFEQYEYYQKMSFRNRCQIAGAEGLINLSVPLEKGRDQKTLIKDVRISGLRPWQAQHWKTIVSCYSRSPWFEFYRDDLEGLYKKPFTFLADWDRACFEWTLGVLKMPVSVLLTGEYRSDYGREDREPGDGGDRGQERGKWIDWRGKILPKNRERVEQGVGVRGEPAGLAEGTPLKYRQVFEERIGFIPDLSILDLLFCEGKEAAVLLKK
jgi:WbqC-like protein family